MEVMPVIERAFVEPLFVTVAVRVVLPPGTATVPKFNDVVLRSNVGPATVTTRPVLMMMIFLLRPAGITTDVEVNMLVVGQSLPTCGLIVHDVPYRFKLLGHDIVVFPLSVKSPAIVILNESTRATLVNPR